MKHLAKSCYILPLLLAAAGTVQAEDTWGDGLSKAVSDGKVSLDFRYRFENVDQDGFSKDATANTLRSRITLATAPWGGFSALLEFDDVTNIGSENYNSLENGKTQYPVIADPEGTDLNQGYFKYAAEDFAGMLGRQRIVHGNQRFIGGVAWRQNEQTFDSLRGTWDPMEILKLDLSYVSNVSRIFGPEDAAQPADLKGDNYFFRADYQMAPDQKLTGYGYWLDFDADRDYASGKTVDNSGDTYGVEYSGKFDWFSINAAYATQSDAGSSTLKYDADYYLVELGAKFGGVGFKGGYEVLGAGDG
ncbi:MAG: alginate export family protein, partial [Proteobacteria bacterium]|nr:alginate export family protein [Pseudomonadota bacterium]